MKKQYMLKVNGRGFFAGGDLRIKHAYLKSDGTFDSGWYTTYTSRIFFKRKDSAITPAFIFKSESDALQAKDLYRDELTTMNNPHARSNTRPLSDKRLTELHGLFAKMIAIEITPSIEKHIVPSKIHPAVRRDLLSLKTGETDVCNACGCTILRDEKALRIHTPAMTVCIHCLKGLGEIIEEAYNETPETYKEEWLIARTINEL